MTQRESADVVEANDRAASSETGRHDGEGTQPTSRRARAACARRARHLRTSL